MKAIFFDLDGTLVDGAPAVVDSLSFALERCGAAPPREQLQEHVGRSLPDIFHELCPGLTEQGLERAIADFRARFAECGIEKSKPYPGIRHVLRRLSSLSLWVVTTKPKPYADQIVEAHFPGVFDGVVGPGLREGATDKTPLFQQAMREADVFAKDALVVGDRKYDVGGAIVAGIEPVGVLWGYGTREELGASGCRHFARKPQELVKELRSLREFSVAA